MKWRSDHRSLRSFNGIQTHGLCISAEVLHQLSYEDPYVGSRPIYGIHRTRERNETYEYYVNCGHTNEIKKWTSQELWLWLRFKQSQSKPEKWNVDHFFTAPNLWVFIAQLVEHCRANAEAMGSNPVEAPKTFFGLTLRFKKSQSQLRWSLLHFIHMSAVHIILMNWVILECNPDYSANSCCSRLVDKSATSYFERAFLFIC